MTDSPPMPEEEFEGSSREEKLGALINEYFDRRESGENISEEEFLARHPDHAADLREHLVGLGLLERLGSSSVRSTVSQETASNFGGSSAEGQALAPDRPLPKLPGYEILKQIGRGGMGVVFKAIQLSTKRAVALKLLLEGALASEVSRRRFEREISLAAQLRHPNIIPIYDSGVADGRMYYAMEYVYGLPLGDYLRLHGTALKDKPRLFVKVCEAVAHAHVRGVVHRDLKPSNILVDNDGEPHILDFGLAKAGALADLSTSITAQIVGTPAYMSPEQASGDPSSIDTRTDVYSLGVMLFETLTGQMPYDTAGAIGKVLKNIADAEPPLPSKLDSKVDDELSAIVLKALAKRKEDRYQSIDALAADLRNYLSGEPISAKPTSGLHLLRMGIWRYRWPIGIVSVAVISLASILTLLQFARTSRAEAHRAVEEKQRLEAKVSETEAARKEAVEGRKRAEDAHRLAEAARREYEWWVKTVDPQLADTLDPVVRAFGKSVGAGEDPALAAANVLTALLSKADTDQQRLTTKDPGLDVQSNASFSPRPAWIQPEGGSSEPPPSPTLDTKRLLEAALRRVQAASTVLPPTTQPAATRPAAPEETIDAVGSPKPTPPASQPAQS